MKDFPSQNSHYPLSFKELCSLKITMRGRYLTHLCTSNLHPYMILFKYYGILLQIMKPQLD